VGIGLVVGVHDRRQAYSAQAVAMRGSRPLTVDPRETYAVVETRFVGKTKVGARALICGVQKIPWQTKYTFLSSMTWLWRI